MIRRDDSIPDIPLSPTNAGGSCDVGQARTHIEISEPDEMCISRHGGFRLRESLRFEDSKLKVLLRKDVAEWARALDDRCVREEDVSKLTDVEASSKCVVHPNSKARGALDIASILVLGFDLITTPVCLAWGFEPDWEAGVSIFMVIFWLTDLVLNLCTGVFLHGHLVTDHWIIVRRYMRTWLLLDVSVIAIDTCNIVLRLTGVSDETSSGLALARLAKVGRYLRVMRLLRSARLAVAIERVARRFYASGLFAFELLKIVFAILWINHIISCAWFAVGRLAASDTGHRWLDLDVSSGDEKTYDATSVVYQYLTCMHFSLTQMTPGSMQVAAVNSPERVFSIFCLVFGMVVFSTLISSLSATLTSFKIRRREGATMLATLREFLRKAHVSHNTGVAVEKLVQERLKLPKQLAFADVTAFSLLPLSMVDSLRCEMFSKYLASFPFLCVLNYLDPLFRNAICREVVDFLPLSPGDTLFVPNTESWR